MRNRFSLLTLAAAGLALAGCGGGRATATPVAYACGGFNLEARFMEEAVRLAIRGNRAVVLPQGISASGARFTDGTTTFWIKGREAMFETRERGVVRCIVSGN